MAPKKAQKVPNKLTHKPVDLCDYNKYDLCIYAYKQKSGIQYWPVSVGDFNQAMELQLHYIFEGASEQ